MGIIFNIQGYAVNDGEGIRTTVFLKGCPLKCDWCSNPEGQLPYPEIFQNKELCIKCYKCLEICKCKSITISPEGYPEFSRDNFKNCKEKECIEECIQNGLKEIGYEISAKELFNKIKSNYLFYRNSNGGITLSGGEPFIQPEFVKEILTLAKENGFSIGVETCGYFSYENVKDFIDDFDFFYFDIKTLNAEMHKECTGLDNTVIINNFKRLCVNSAEKITVSIPLIPGFNTDKNSILEIISYCKENNVNKARLLAYHNLGISKYEALGRKYKKEFAFISKDESESLKNLFLANGIQCNVE